MLEVEVEVEPLLDVEAEPLLELEPLVSEGSVGSLGFWDVVITARGSLSSSSMVAEALLSALVEEPLGEELLVGKLFVAEDADEAS